MGWNVRNEGPERVAPQNREVVIEPSLEVEGNRKSPDYAFRIGHTPKFYVEAKKCGVNIKSDPTPAFQLRRYAWNGKLPLSILTDFEELAVYDCTSRPYPSDKVSKGRIQYYNFEQYPDCWGEIWKIFSREAVWSGSFDQFTETKRGRRGTSEVDAEFLKEIETWRDVLARNIALRNAGLSIDDLNRAVQLTIDRIIFLRMAEDRKLERERSLLDLAGKTGIYKRFIKDLCQPADDRYNSGLFDLKTDRRFNSLEIDDKVLKPILQSIYPEHDSPYMFDVMPVEILGTVYERFLGKVIRLTAGHHAKIEEKPEVRKAGGVYYTPAYIVDYIVQQTVGKQIEGKSPRQLRGEGSGKNAQPLRVLDMACGSGSFLLGAYQCLLNDYLKWYTENSPEKHKQAVWQKKSAQVGGEQEWRLTIQEKKRILTTHIFGVDIDAQAVEVTKLSLLLKVLEGEDDESLGSQIDWIEAHERALPNLDQNIKCGNSLIGPDYFTGDMFPDAEELKRINPFDWQHEFPAAINSGGFDCIIGNPPYGAQFNDDEKKFLLNNYSAQNYQLDSYLLFIEKGLRSLLKDFGRLGYIMPNPWLTNILQRNARKFVADESRIVEIVHFQFPVFPKVTVDCQIVILEKHNPSDWNPKTIIALTKPMFCEQTQNPMMNSIIHDQNVWRSNNGDVINIFLGKEEMALAARIRKISEPLSNWCKITVGIKPYQKGKGVPPQTKNTVQNRPFDSDKKLDPTFRCYLRGSDIQRYLIQPVKERYLKYGSWLAEPRPSANFDAEKKIVMRQTGDSLVAALDTEQYLCLNNMHVIVPYVNAPSIFYLIGIINSRLLNWYYQTLNPEKGEALAEVKKSNVERLLIRQIDRNFPAIVKQQDHIIELVKAMLALHKQLAKTNGESEQRILQRQIDATDREIDRLVYELYELTPEEIAIVEGNN
ncbi:N-6 DNA methylase [Candidatus Sumerlaeota bacterium]|nr:N-6 DNA methylase [Candidatus Sumerlaeota bacterium]